MTGSRDASTVRIATSNSAGQSRRAPAGCRTSRADPAGQRSIPGRRRRSPRMARPSVDQVGGASGSPSGSSASRSRMGPSAGFLLVARPSCSRRHLSGVVRRQTGASLSVPSGDSSTRWRRVSGPFSVRIHDRFHDDGTRPLRQPCGVCCHRWSIPATDGRIRGGPKSGRLVGRCHSERRSPARQSGNCHQPLPRSQVLPPPVSSRFVSRSTGAQLRGLRAVRLAQNQGPQRLSAFRQ